MRKIGRRTFIKNAAAAGGSGAAFLAAPGAFAQEAGWPTKPIHFIVPLAPGGAIDFIARAVGDVIQRNAASRSWSKSHRRRRHIGMDAAMKSAPDGYTVLITNDNAASAPHIMKLSYDYTKQLQPVCYLGRQSQISRCTVARRQHRERACRLREGQPGAGLRFVRRRLQPARRRRVVRQRGRHQDGARALSRRRPSDQRSDRRACENRFLGPTALIPHDKAGTVKLLAHTGSKRSPILPEVPTLEETGYKVVLDAWYAAFVPEGTPAGIVGAQHRNE